MNASLQAIVDCDATHTCDAMTDPTPEIVMLLAILDYLTALDARVEALEP